mmetsp:Transcript_13850/g.24258  ORF Transcript_13850/g.24258 Transcript_13850/m.24258 type:complete len:264 (+) Transcript_13850:430-1221(+)
MWASWTAHVLASWTSHVLASWTTHVWASWASHVWASWTSHVRASWTSWTSWPSWTPWPSVSIGRWPTHAWWRSTHGPARTHLVGWSHHAWGWSSHHARWSSHHSLVWEGWAHHAWRAAHRTTHLEGRPHHAWGRAAHHALGWATHHAWWWTTHAHGRPLGPGLAWRGALLLDCVENGEIGSHIGLVLVPCVVLFADSRRVVRQIRVAIVTIVARHGGSCETCSEASAVLGCFHALCIPTISDVQLAQLVDLCPRELHKTLRHL